MMNSKIFGKISAMRLSVFLTALIVVTLLGLSPSAYAEEITYIGDGKNLCDSPSWFSDEVDLSLFPGSEKKPLASGNKITMDYDPSLAGVTNPAVVFGGLSETGNVSGNEVTLLNGRAQEGLFGGFCREGDVESNTVTVSGGIVAWHVFGGYSDKGSINGNTVVINGGSMAEDVDGGYSENGSAAGNTITINGGYVGGDVSGGWSASRGAAANNRINIGGGSVAGDIVGGCGFDGGSSGNEVVIGGGLVTGDVDGGYSEKDSAAGNTVTINGGSVGGDVSGGWSDNIGSATNNRINIGGGSVAGDIVGGCSFDGDASGNTIFIGGGSVSGDVDGGYSKKGSATGNAVTISGGAVSGVVSGGWSKNKDATDNVITISGRPNLAKAHIWGGNTEDLLGDHLTGNTLNLKNGGTLVASVGNFEYYNFDLPKNLAAGAVMLSVIEQAGLKGTTVAISLPDGAKLRKGDKIALIHSAKGVILGAPKNKSCQVKQGGVLYEFSIYTDSSNLWAEVTKISKAAQ